ncbi:MULTISPECIES: putative Ig domain-containing protein [Flavobacterium]|uniref:putative Ig domain-containing protein n=1 Tax=Flavobacterium TaxID=237 RepID=UPI001FCB308A|nr:MULTISPECIES: putative Ig domain-containing protein [Flavobacterium]UOK42528.1 T9SS type A sorting domain-containing protein [Flavobacterium enshiense]
MIKNYSYLFLLLLLSNFCWGLNYTKTKTVSYPTICIGNNATTTLSSIKKGVSYHLRQGITKIGTSKIGSGDNLDFIVSPRTTTYNKLANYAPSSPSGITDVSTMTVGPAPKITLTSANATQTGCANLAITNIVYNITNVTTTGVSASGLPAGVNGNYDAGVYTISGTPTVAGTFGFTVTATNADGTVTTSLETITVTPLPTATINYAGSPFCKSLATAQSVTRSGTGGGTYSASPSGLNINSSTGAITPSTSSAGTYTVTYTIPASGGCAAVANTTSVTITAEPTASINYTGTPFCTSIVGTRAVTLTGTGGTFSAPAGLSINTSTGDITPSTSTPGTYTVTYTIPASGGCATKQVTTSVTIIAMPTASISYNGTPFCTSLAAPQSVTLTGAGAYTGGTFSAPLGLSIHPSTGTITPSASTAGTYTVTYTTPASGNCAAVAVTTSVTITEVTATINYAGTPFCTSIVGTRVVSLTGAGAYTGGTFSAPAQLTIDSITGDITPSTSTPGTYTVTYTIPASGGCATKQVTTSVTITAVPTASINYNGTPFCTSLAAPQSVTLTGTGAYTLGTFSAPTGLSIHPSTGAITPSASTAGTYTVTYTTPASGNCAAVTATTSVTITAIPTATISYAGNPFCITLGTVKSVTLSGSPAYTGGTFSAPVGLSIDSSTGDITPSTSTPGTYTVTYNIPAGGGCAITPITTSVTITAVPTANISYTGTPFCTSIVGTKVVSLTGTGAYTGGTYTASSTGLTMDSATGAITPSSSTAGTYTVTYTTPASGGCAAEAVTTSVTITTAPTATISYAGTAFCISLATIQSVSLIGTAAYTGGTFSAPAGLSIDASTGDITPSTSTPGTYTVTYNVPASGGCSVVSATTSVTITAVPTANINYAGTPFCTSLATPQSVTRTGSGAYTGGTYTASPGGLAIDSATGAITPNTSTAGTYTVTYTTPASGGCAAVAVTASVTITTAPTATISYAGTPFCKSLATIQSVSLIGTAAYTGGTFSAPAGLSIDASTGDITPSGSTPGTYTVTYNVPASGGCSVVSATTSVTITAVPTANISYAGTPFCTSIVGPKVVSLTGTGAYTGGTYTASSTGLTMDSATGAITPSSSTAGTYTVTYTTPASGGCAAEAVTTSVTITTAPTATISYAGTAFCISLATIQSVSLIGTAAYTGGTFSAPAGLSIDASTGDITPSTSTPGTYMVTYTIPASGGCAVVSATTSVTITAVPTATINYAGTPFCTSIAGTRAVSLTGTGAYTGGTYTASSTGLTIDSATGSITPNTSTAGTYTVTYTTPASGGCAAVAVTTSVTITTAPTATISYAGTPFCISLATIQSVSLIGTAAYTGGTFSAPAGLSIDASTGDITPSGSTPGTYTVTYNVPASGGCSVVSATTSVTITAVPTANISYAGTPFCTSITGTRAVSLTGTGAYTGGTYTASATGLTIDSATGAITPSTSTGGTYTVTYTTPSSGGCAAVAVTTNVTITTAPTATISYSGTAFCKSLTTAQSVTLSGTAAYTGGTYTTSSTGLTIDSTSGAITPSSSTAGTYTITYKIPASGGCASVNVTTNIAITDVPTATITYAGLPFCRSLSTVQNVTRTGTGAYTGGIYTASPGGLVIDSASGAITPNTSTAGTYTVTYTTPASGGCAAVAVTTSVAITAVPTAIISYAGTSFCKSLTTAQSVTLSGTGAYTGGTYSASSAGLTIDSTSGAITPSSSTAGTYTITYKIPASGGCASVNVTTNITITDVPTATITYAGSQFCPSVSVGQNVTLNGTGAYTGGTYSASPAGLSINSLTGTIIPSTSTVGTYTVTYSTPASGGCSPVNATTTVIIDINPVGGSVSESNSSITNPEPKCFTASGTLYLLGHVGTVVKWQYSNTAGTLWVDIPNTNATNTYNNITQNTYFRAVVRNASGCSTYSMGSMINVIPNLKPSPVIATPATICSGGSSVLSSTSSYATSSTLATGGAFSVANPPGWQVDTCNNCLSSGGSNSVPGQWQLSSTNGKTYSGVDYTSDGKFAIAHGEGTPSYMYTPVFNTFGLTNATLTFKHAYNFLAGARGEIQISIDGGSTYTTIQTYQGSLTPTDPFTAAANSVTIDLNAYLGQGNLKIRFYFHGLDTVSGNPNGSSWAIDNIAIPDAPVNFSTQWVDTATGVAYSSSTSMPVSPTVTTTYAVTSYLNNCNSFGTTGTAYVTVTVKQRPTAVISQNHTVCKGDNTTFSIALTGAAPWHLTYFNGTSSVTVDTSTNPYVFAVNNVTSPKTCTVTALDDANCTAKPSDINGSATVTVNERPTAVLGTDQLVCSGDSANLTVNFTGTGPWNITYNNGSPTPTTITGITANPYTFAIPNNTVTTTYMITALSDSKCTAKSSDITGSAKITVINGTAGLWTGLVSTDWFDCKNWAGGLPSATVDAIIPTITTGGRMPIIDPLTSPYTSPPYNPNAIASARDVIINTNASISMTANSNLHVKKDWKNSGSFIPGTGTVTFNGDTASQVHLINSGIKTNEAFYNLTVNCTNGAKGINVADAFELTVANNLVLTNGDLRLTGEAQLIQNGTTANPAGGTGVLLRDQQGTKSSYHYNQWSSPVSTDNLNYTIGGVLKDGTNATASPFSQNPINFGWGYDFSDGPLTSPIKISNRWLYKYTQISTSYWSWQLIESTGSVKVGEGFIMKGVTGLEPVTNYQNYVFAGKPNNGNINLTIAPNQNYLIGNPYPSAMDANEFILDNISGIGRASTNAFNGALYFWDHFSSTTHYLAEYVGGYAVYNLTGGVKAFSEDPMINNNMASGSKIPTQYIPVAQGFFVDTSIAGVGGVTGAITGGTIRFKNSQRKFVTESSSNSIFIRNENQTVGSNIDNRQKIRLSFEAPSGLHRQLLVGADPQATNLFDIGYDAPMIDVNPDDMYWNLGDGKFVIQAVSDFNLDQVIPLGIKVSTAGTTKIKIDELENIPTSTEIYLFDSVTGLYHDIKNENFVAEFPIGEYPDRFTLRFTAETLSTDEMDATNGIMVFTDSNHILNIKNNLMDTRVEVIELYNILGQSITKWDVADEDQRNIKIPVDHIRTGTYIVKLKTSYGSLSKKVIIR